MTLDNKVEQLTIELTRCPENSAKILIERGSYYLDKNDFVNARSDFALAAKIMDSDKAQKIPENVSELSRLLKKSSISPSSDNSTKVPTDSTTSDTCEQISLLFSQDFITNIASDSNSNNFEESKTYSLFSQLLRSFSLNNFLSSEQQENLIKLYFKLIKTKQSLDTTSSSTTTTIPSCASEYPNFTTYNSTYHQTVNLLLKVISIDFSDSPTKALNFLKNLLSLWDSKIPINDKDSIKPGFVFDKMNIFNYQSVSSIFPNALFLSISDSNSSSEIIISATKILFNELFFYSSFSCDSELSLSFVQQVIKLVSLPNFNINNIFSNSPFLICLYSDEYPLLSPKTLTNKKVNGPLIQLLSIIGSSNHELSRAGSVLLSLILQKIENPQHQNSTQNNNDFSLFVSSTQTVLSEWITSTFQSDKARGLRVLTASFFAQNSKLGPNLIMSQNLISHAFDLWENDSPQTKLCLLNAVDSILTRNECKSFVYQYGSSFLSSFVNKIKSYSEKTTSNSMFDSEIIVTAANVFSKLSVTENFESIPESSQSAPDQNLEISSISESTFTDTLSSNLIPGADLLDFYSKFLESSSSLELKIVELIAEGLGYLSLQTVLKNKICFLPQIISSLLRYSSIDIKSHPNKDSFKNRLHIEKTLSINFAIISIVSNLVYRKPLLTEDQIASQKLRKAALKKKDAASASKKSAKEREQQEKLIDLLESNDSVNKRCLLLSKVGSDSSHHLLPFLVSSFKFVNDGSTLSSSSTKIDLIINIIHSFLFIPELRGRLVQLGVVKNLVLNSTILSKSDSTLTTSKNKSKTEQSNKNTRTIKEFEFNSRDFIVALSLAKIAISIPPNLAFPPNGPVTANSLISPFLSLCANTNHDQLCNFEALLALTNFAATNSYPQSTNNSDPLAKNPAFELVNTYKGLDIIDMLVLSGNTLIRRASVELICNLVASVETAFMHFINGSEKIPTISKSDFTKIIEANLDSGDIVSSLGLSENYRSHKLHLLAALSDIDFDNVISEKGQPLNQSADLDPKTSLASLGAIATLVNHPNAAKFLICCHPKFLLTLCSILSSNLYDFIYRAVVILITILSTNSQDKYVLERIATCTSLTDNLKLLSSTSSKKLKFGLFDIEGKKVDLQQCQPIINFANECLNIIKSVP
ncbi:Protein unc-45-like protein [Smittium culicis]|uniref:Protein unc-45-like protein n=1 Tax=Smittium culicis TaxID=133412 RepID=A0A1R1WYR7_9FUNG|nr:Protein unc-45-like protein [Smittium culicis]OMJ07673.1 Protein unc-45-like protein [Smittium culicis]